MTKYPGIPYPLGATWNGEGVNFALFAENATGVELCLFDCLMGATQSVIIDMTERTHQLYHVYLPGVRPGQLYGYRVHGTYDPASGNRFNAAKLVIDPYAKAIAGTVEWDDSLFGYEVGNPEEDLKISEKDSAPFIPKCVVIDPSFDWEGDRPPKVPYHQSIIYEAHVKGFTRLHPSIPDDIKGTYAGLAHPVAVESFS